MTPTGKVERRLPTLMRPEDIGTNLYSREQGQEWLATTWQACLFWTPPLATGNAVFVTPPASLGVLLLFVNSNSSLTVQGSNVTGKLGPRVYSTPDPLAMEKCLVRPGGLAKTADVQPSNEAQPAKSMGARDLVKIKVLVRLYR